MTNATMGSFEHLYRPQHKSEKELVEDFVVRLKERTMFLEELRKDGPGQVSQHHIIIGVRGMGKTTLMRRLTIDIKSDAELNTRFIAVQPPEESYPVNSLFDLAEWVAEHLAATDPIFHDLAEVATTEDGLAMFHRIEEALQRAEKKAVLLMDNLGDLFWKLSGQENHALREILITTKYIKLIGGTAVALEELYTHSSPYYKLFSETELKKLDQGEVEELLLQRAAKHGDERVRDVVMDQPGRVNSLRILTGGVPRTIVMLYDVFAAKGNMNAFDDLNRTLEAVTPLYKHRMDDLPPQKQKIAHVMAIHWDGMSASEIAVSTRLESKGVSAQLSQMVKDGFVIRDTTSTKNHLYQLAERFFNIWYLMNHAPKRNGQKVKWLTRFLEVWCDPETLRERAIDHLNAMDRSAIAKEHAVDMTAAMMNLTGLDYWMRYGHYQRTKDYISDRQDLQSELCEPSGSPVDAHELRRKGNEAMTRSEYAEAERLYSQSSRLGHMGALHSMGKAQEMMGKLTEAEHTYRLGIDKGNTWSMLSLGNMLRSNKDFSGAAVLFDQAMNAGNGWAAHDRARLAEEMADPVMAERSFAHAVRMGNSFSMEPLHAYLLKRMGTTEADDTLSGIIQQDNAGQMLTLAHIYYSTSRKRKEAWGLVQKAMALSNRFVSSWNAKMAFMVAVWNDEFAFAFGELIPKIENDDVQHLGNDELLLCLAKKQFATVKRLFDQNEKLKDRFRPIYFATLYLMRDTDPDSYKRMGKELEEPVMSIVARVEEMAIKYR